jgi:hypothetical protein
MMRIIYSFFLFCLFWSNCSGQPEVVVLRTNKQIAVEGVEEPAPTMYADFYIATKADSLLVYSNGQAKVAGYRISGYVVKNPYYFIQMGKRELVLEYEQEVGAGEIKGAFWIDKINNYSLYLYAKKTKKI